MNRLLLQYAYLQILDFLTTVAFLVHGVQEANPLVRFAMGLIPGVLPGLILVKTGALALGGYCWYTKKERLLARINFLFALIVAWNLVADIVSATYRS